MSKIIVIEDNDKNRRLILDVLRYHGYNLLEAPNGADGVNMAKEQKPDLILMDIQMPVMDGLAALKILRETPQTKDIKVIALTSLAMTDDKEKIITAGFDDYISKPINTRELPKLVKKWLEKKDSK